MKNKRIPISSYCLTNLPLKHCFACDTLKPVTAFHRQTGSNSNVWHHCADCRNRHIVDKRHGLHKGEFKYLLNKQNNRCAICLKCETFIRKGKKVPLSVDHCHITGKIRGLLCINCNRALGLFYDNIESLTKAINYLKENQ